jgi:hypothetical protein
VSFTFQSDEITTGCRCNCSICMRKGSVMSSRYFPPGVFSEISGKESLTLYQFGDGDVNHYFCKTCGISPFNEVASVPANYEGPAKPGDRRVNLGCIDGLDPFTLEVSMIDGRSF